MKSAIGRNAGSHFLKPKVLASVLLACLVVCSSAVARAAGQFGDLQYRWLGPAIMGGRLDVVAGVPGDPKTIYAGHASGGLWKSEDGGTTFSSVFEVAKSSAIGAIAVDPQNPRTVYVATGESVPRNTAEAGDGLWVSHDAAKTWTHLGFERAGSITRIAIDPRDSRALLVAVLGDEFAPSTTRGIYRSTDTGRTWQRVLFVNDTTGGSDIAFDPRDPSIVYAGTFDFLRRPWHMRSGGPGSGLYRSANGGRTWTRLTDKGLHNGLPAGPINRVGVSVCASDPRIVYAYVPVKNGMLYRTLDAGAHWQLRNADQEINFRPFYFSQVRCDPHDPQRVYAIGGELLVSKNGGTKFSNAGGGGDNHDLWIDPTDSSRLINGSDIGLDISLDSGKTWNHDNVVPFAQVYRVGYDMEDPYHVMGGMQDHEVWWGPSNAYNTDGIYGSDWHKISDWGDGQYAMADPTDSATVYVDTHFGDLSRVNLTTGERRYISPQPIQSFGTAANTYRYRFSWSAPLLVSHFDAHTIYFGGNVLFKSADRGEHWSAISRDTLTQCRPEQLLPSGGPITNDNTNAETFCTVYAIAEDAVDSKTLWIGTDTGHIAITRDGGSTWERRDISSSSYGARIAALAASPKRPGVAYAAVDRHEWNDPTPHVFVTSDYGATWRPIDRGLDGYVHVVREDPRNPNVLYAGTERGVFVSFDAGGSWNDLRLGLPHVPVYDLQIHPRDNDLIVGTHARGFYVLDDLTPLQHFTQTHSSRVYLFDPMPATRFARGFPREAGRGEFVTEPKPEGALLTFFLAKAPPAPPKQKAKVRIRILDGSTVIAAFETEAHAGLNRAVWNLRTLPNGGAKVVQDPREYYVFYPLAIRGPKAVPGRYAVEVSDGTDAARAALEVRMDPKHPVAPAELQKQRDALESIDAAQSDAESAVARLVWLRHGLQPYAGQAGAIGRHARDAAGTVERLLDGLRNPERSGYRQAARPVEQLAYLRDTIEQYDGAPTAAQMDAIASYRSAVVAAVQAERAFEGGPLTELNRLLRESGKSELLLR